MKIVIRKRPGTGLYEVLHGDRRLGLMTQADDDTWTTLRNGRTNTGLFSYEDAIKSLIRSAARDQETAPCDRTDNSGFAIALASVGVVLLIAIAGLAVQVAQKPQHEIRVNNIHSI